ncbi:MAG: hypothetical protein SOY13_12595 [Pseudoflavonifractor sp.]|nr:hypothetical protein [Pseudoflavonifractor sp.]
MKLFYHGIKRRAAKGGKRKALMTFSAASPLGRILRPDKTIQSFYRKPV